MNIKKQADEIVEQFMGMPYNLYSGDLHGMLMVAIIHVEGLISLLDDVGNVDAVKRYDQLTEILTELKSRI